MVKLFRPLLLVVGLFISSMMIPGAGDDSLMKAYNATTEESRHVINSFNLTISESNKIDKYPAICPLFKVSDASRISSPYGPRIHPIHHCKSIHRGIDYAAPKGSKVITTGDGIVLAAKRNGGYGNMITIRHSNGYKTRYGHLDTMLVHKGDSVNVGDIIGTIGTTGLSTGNHLHYEILHQYKHLDPLSIYPDTLKQGTYLDFMSKLNDHLLSCSDDV